MAYKTEPRELERVRAELIKWNRQDIDRWEFRNRRMQQQQELYQLQRPTDVTARNPADIVITNDPRVAVKKIARLIARHPNLIDVTPAPDSTSENAQILENWLYLYDQAINQSWIMGLHHPYRYEQAMFQCLRGWQCLRTMLRPDDDEDFDEDDPLRIFDHQIFDPVNVYPFAAGGKIRRVTHAYDCTLAELYSDPFYYRKLEEDWGELEDHNPNRKATVHATYWLDGENTWQHAVLCTAALGSESSSCWIKEPVELGYNPWTIVVSNGSPYGRTPWSDLDYLEEVGTGVLDDNIDMYKTMNRMITKLNELLSLEVNPPVTAFVQDGKIRPLNFYPGSRNVMTLRDKIDVHKFGPQLGDFKLLWDIISQRIARAGLPPAFFAEYSGESGFSASVLLAAGKDVLFPFTEAVNAADALKYRKVLEIYRDFGPNKALRSKIRPDGLGRVLSADLTREIIKEQGVYVEVTREDMTPQEMATRIQMGLAQVKDKAISLETFRKEYAKIKNPHAENIKVLAEQVYLSEDVIKALIPDALTAQGQEALRRVWEITQNPLPPPGGAPQGPPGLPPGAAPPQGVPPGLPPGAPVNPMLPGQAAPPIAANPMMGPTPMQMMNPALAAAQQNPLLAMLNGGALGGIGLGGTPPPPNMPQVLGPRLRR